MLNLYTVSYDTNDDTRTFEYGALAVVAAYDARDAECVIEDHEGPRLRNRLVFTVKLIGTPKENTERGLVDLFCT